MALIDLRFVISDLFRPGRMRVLARAFALSRKRVLDIGGTATIWWLLPPEERPRLTILNLEPRPSGLPNDIEYVQGTALALPFARGDFDLVFSNSVIEHVGSWRDQQRFAAEVRRLGCPYYIQTPNRYFPIEPHYLGLGVQFLPRAVAWPIVRYSTVWGLTQRPRQDQIESFMRHVRLLTAAEMRLLFPGAEIWRERLFGLTKSVTAVSGVAVQATAGVLPLAPAAARGPEPRRRHIGAGDAA